MILFRKNLEFDKSKCYFGQVKSLTCINLIITNRNVTKIGHVLYDIICKIDFTLAFRKYIATSLQQSEDLKVLQACILIIS